MNSSCSAKLVICPPVDPSGKIAATPFEVDWSDVFTSSFIIPAFPLTGSGTTTLPLGSVPAAGLRLFALMLDQSDNPAPIQVTWTYVDSTTGGVKEVTAGPSSPGVALAHSANPANGITAVSVTHSGNAVVRYVAIG